jgi:hypothetical protein
MKSKSLFDDENGSFCLLDFNRSHGQLLLRKRVDRRNTDIIFKSVQFLCIPSTLYGVKIRVIIDYRKSLDLKSKYNFALSSDYRVFEILDSQGNEYFIVASVFGVYENDLDILETSIGDFTWSNENKLIFWSNDV